MEGDEEISENATGVSSVRPGHDTLAHRVLARVYADEALAIEDARRVVVAHGGRRSKKQKEIDARAAEAAQMARELPGGTTISSIAHE